MYVFDSFGRRIPAKGRAMRRNPTPGDPTPGGPGTNPQFVAPPAPAPTPAPAPVVEPNPVDLGFPENTPIADMTADQELAYWKHHARKHERAAAGRADYDTIKAERDRLAAANQTAEERALEEARLQGETIGADRYLVPAVQAHFQRLSGLDDEKTATAFRHVDPKSFTTATGDIDSAALAEFASTFTAGVTPAPTGPLADPIAEAARRQQQAGNQQVTTSIAEATRLRAEQLGAGTSK